ncbi:diguanylate cyclase [Lichenihabitans sp. Uapishka_5]|uniref:diguanylate cyclase domain-containing protein n=1 Tax=Lichenihabitans sp. Uapishka_5 TaxID=3037302 RepID=UPI0029E7CF10|nr:diguanylate cyclase [Lichenihabitans sp. Uapishka_5]MDX7953876.1 diguanylate cyclase [Lichenihabitans sp. Uapishka_5]
MRRYQDALEALPEAIAIFDEDDRFVFWNQRFTEIYGMGIDLRVGTRFADHLRHCIVQGLVPSAVGREEAWLAERLSRFADAEGAHEHRLTNGRWVRVQDRRLAHGGRIGIRADITEAREREESFRLLFDANPVPMIVSDVQTHEIIAVNDAAVAFYGYAREQFLKLRIRDIRPEHTSGEIAAFIQNNMVGSMTAGAIVTHWTAGGKEKLVRMAGCRLDYGGQPAVLAAIFDLTEQHRAEQEVSSARIFLTEIVDQVPVAVFAKDLEHEGRFVIYNRASETLFGRTRAEVIGRTDAEVFGAEVAARFAPQDEVALRVDKVATFEDEIIHRPDGSERFLRTQKVGLSDRPENPPRYILGVSEDVTERRANEARIAHMAHHDALTDLPNRFLFHERLASALVRRRDGECLAAIFLDLDGFKAVNDTHGHAIGDDLLKQVADRLRAALRACDTAARFGGDEFAILQSVMSEPGEAAWLAGKLVATLSAPYQVGTRDLKVSASAGVALAPFDAADPNLLLERADAALYRAKREGRNTFRFASPHVPSGETNTYPSLIESGARMGRNR